MSPLRETYAFFRELAREHRILLALVVVALLRLLTNFDSYLTIRDTDFFPHNIGEDLSFHYRGGRPLALWLNWLWSLVAGKDALWVKQSFAKLYVVAYVPVFIALARRFGQSAQAAAVSLLLFLAGSVTFALYDALGPYFLLFPLTGLQLIYMLDAIEEEGPFWHFCLASLVALVCHRNAIFTTTLALGLMGMYRRRLLYETVADFVFSLGLLTLVIVKVKTILAFDWHARVRQLHVHPPHVFEAAPNDLTSITLATLRELAALGPRFVGVDIGVTALSLVASGLIVWVVVRGRRTLKPPLYLYALGVFGLALLLVVMSQYYGPDLFFLPNHATYNSMLVPLLFLFIGGEVARLHPRAVAIGLVVVLLGSNLWFGYQYRGEAFDVAAYDRSVEELETKHLPRYLTPAFVPSVYSQWFPEGYENRPFIRDERTRNDFTLITDREFHFDVVQYDEMGTPFCRYASFQRRFEEFLDMRGYQHTMVQHHTFVRYHARMK